VSPIVRLARAYFRPHLPTLGLTFVLSLLGVFVELARPWPIKIVIDYALTDHPLPPFLRTIADWLPGGGAAGAIIGWSAVAAGLIVLTGAGLSLCVLMINTRISRGAVFAIGGDLFAKLQRLSLSYHGRSTVGDLLQRVAGDVFVLFSAVSQVLLPTAIALVTLLGMFLIMARLDITLTLIALSVVPLMGAALAFFRGPIDQTSRRQAWRAAQLMALVEQSLLGIKVIQAFARERYVQEQVATGTRELGNAYSASARIGGGFSVANSAITGVATAALLGLGAFRVREGNLTLGDLIVFLAYVGALFAPLQALSNAAASGAAISARARRVLEVLDAQDEVPERPNALVPAGCRAELVFDGVSFGYEAERLVLRDLSFEAHRGQVTAIVGVTGAGKTSLISLLSRFYDPSAGRILLDGNDLRDLSLRWLREHVSLVLQEPFLFPLPVAENIAFGEPKATRDEIEAAAKIARAHDFIEELPDGYDTVLAERAVFLSGGERQRIAMARAILKDAPILILDEPTSSVDVRTESEIFDALVPTMREKTTFVVSHRLSTILLADQILVLEHGSIVEHGSHAELLETGGVYAQLCRHQYRGLVARSEPDGTDGLQSLPVGGDAVPDR
jgi:ABC-type multidrug transport system fused ATPase/permease subunit